MKIEIKKLKTSPLFPKKAKVIFVFEDGIVIHGDGMVNAVKSTTRQAVFTATLVKPIPK